jgi:hypothetical protein
MAPQEETARTTSEPQPDEPEKMTRKEHLAEHNEKCERIVHYLRHGKHQAGLSKNQQRVVRGQAKNYVLDETSKYDILFSNLNLCYVKFVCEL